MGEVGKGALRMGFDGSLKLEFHGSRLLPRRTAAMSGTGGHARPVRDLPTGRGGCAAAPVPGDLGADWTVATGPVGAGMTAETVETVPEGGGDGGGVPASAADTSRSERDCGPATAGLPRHRGEEVFADLAIGSRIVQKVDGGRRPEAIREIPDYGIGTG